MSERGDLAGEGLTRRSPWSSLLIFGLFGVLFFLRLGSYGVVDYDEGCYAEVSRAMFVAGEWLEPSLNEEPFFEKPPLLYWAQIAGSHFFGVGPWAVRFLNACAALALLVVLRSLTRGPFGELGSWLVVVVLGTSLQFFALARVSLTDTFLSLWFVLCLGWFHRARVRFDRDGGGHRAFWIACFFAGLATLTKGAIGIVLPAVTAATIQFLERRRKPVLTARWFIPGTGIVLGVGLSWYLALGFSNPEGFGFMTELFLEHHVGRFLEPMQGHSGSFFYYVPVLLIGFLPWSPLAVLALLRFGRREIPRGERADFVRLFLVFATWTLLLFSVAGTKLPNYVTPILPALAIGVAELLETRWKEVASRGERRVAMFTAGAFGAFALFFAALPVVIANLRSLIGDKIDKEPGLLEPISLGWLPWGTAVVLAVGGVFLHRARRGTSARRTKICAGSFGVFLLLLGAAWLPAYDRIAQAPLRAAAHTADGVLPAGAPIHLVGIRHKPSVRFVTGRRTEYRSKRDENALRSLFAGEEVRVAIVSEGNLDRVTRLGAIDIIDRHNGYVVFKTRR